MRSHVNWKSIAVSAAMLVTSAAVPYAVMTDAASSFAITASAASSTYSLNLNQAVTYSALPKDDKMIGWEWSEFNIPASENVTKVEINISTTKDKLGKWQGAFGTSTTVSPEYWTQTDEMTQTISGKSGTLTWNVDSATSKIIQREYNGELKFGIWWIDCDTFTIDSIKVTTDGTGSAVTTTAPTTTAAATTTSPTSSSGGAYTLNLNQAVTYSSLPENDKMIGWEWADFNIPTSENVTKVEFVLSTTKDKLGKWQGAFGSSTTVSPDYWTQTDEITQTFSGKTGTITWNVDSATSKIIQRGYGGELKFGTWWIDCDSFTIDSIRVYTDGSSSAVTTTTPAVTTTSKITTTAKTTTPATTTTSVSSSNVYTFNPKQDIVYSELPEDDRMIGWEWAEFNIPIKENITKVEIDISTTKDKIGKWQGAFGTSTTVSPEYWTQTDEMTQTFSGKTGTLVWNVDAATSKIIQRNYNGMLKFGTWWIDCDAFTVDSIRVYTDASYADSTTIPPSVVTTTSKTTTTPAATTTSVSSDNVYTFNPKQDIVYSELPEDDRMIGWEWAEFNIPAKDNITKVEIDISTTKDKLGKWEGAFGTSTTVSPEYWTQTADMEQTFSGKTGTITWNVDSATSKIIQRYYNGMLKFGTWWIDCDSFTIDSIRVYTDGASSAVTTTTPATTTKPSESTTKAPATTTTKPSESTTKAPATTTKPSESTTKAPATTTVPSGTTASGEDVKATLIGDANKDGVVDVVDVTMLKQSVVKLVTLDAQQAANADIIADGVVDVKDLGQLIKYIIKVIDKL